MAGPIRAPQVDDGVLIIRSFLLDAHGEEGRSESALALQSTVWSLAHCLGCLRSAL